MWSHSRSLFYLLFSEAGPSCSLASWCSWEAQNVLTFQLSFSHSLCEPNPASLSPTPALPPPTSRGDYELWLDPNPSSCAHSMMSFCSPVKESTDNNHQVELDQTGEKPTFPCCHEWQRRCFVVHWARKVSRAAREEGNHAGREKGEEHVVKAGSINGQVFALILLHGLTDLC